MILRKFFEGARIGKMLAVICFLGMASYSSASDKTITIAADTWCPYNCDARSREPGFMIDVVREALEPQGYKIQYINLAWTKAMAGVLSGELDAIVGAGASEAKNMIMAAEPLGENRTCFYTRQDDQFVFTQGKSIASRRIGVISGYLYGAEIDQYIASHRANYSVVQVVTGDKPLLQNIIKLKARRIDTVIENLAVMDFSVRKFRVDGIRLAGCEDPTPLYIAFSPRRSDAGRLAEIMTAGIRALRKKGEMSRILARYGLKDWK